MNLADDELIKAEKSAAGAREQLARTAVALQTRLKPRELVHDAADGLKKAGSGLASKGLQTVRRNPFSALGTVAALGLFLGRKPLGRLIRGRPTRS